MNSQIIGKKIEKNDPFEQNNESTIVQTLNSYFISYL